MATIVEQQKEGAVLASFATLSILQLIKDAQQKHGLRHGDYQRYRGYCGRRVRRIRKSLAFTHIHRSVAKHPAKFVQRKLSFDIVTEERYLQVAVFDAERNWSYAMQLKQEAGDNVHSRKRYHMIAKLRRAVKNTTLLESVIKACERTDAVTKLESQAYNSWMNGYLGFEQKQWKSALECFATAKKIYEKLAEVVKVANLVELYKNRCREIQPQIRYCEYNCASDLSDMAMSEMINMRLHLKDDEGALQEDFDKLITELRSKAVLDHVINIEWANQKIAIVDDNIKNLLQTIEQFDEQLRHTAEYDDKITLYEQLLIKIRDVIQSLADERKKNIKVDSEKSLASNEHFSEYLEFIRLTRTVERYILIISHSRSQTEKKAKPQDLIRLYDSVVENCSDILKLQGVSSNAEYADAFAAKIEFYRAFRCFYLAEAYKDASKFQEADALYDRSMQRAINAGALLRNSRGKLQIAEKREDLDVLVDEITASKYATQTAHLEKTTCDVEEMVADDENDDQPLSETLQKYRKIKPENLLKVEQGIRVIPFPPTFIPMPNKPVFFDNAYQFIENPDLQAKIEAYDTEESSAKKKESPSDQGQEENVEQGISGIVKGWLWGTK